MRRLLLGFALGSAAAWGTRRLLGAEPEPPPWHGTDNDPEDRATLADDLLGQARPGAPLDYDRESQASS